MWWTRPPAQTKKPRTKMLSGVSMNWRENIPWAIEKAMATVALESGKPGSEDCAMKDKGEEDKDEEDKEEGEGDSIDDFEWLEGKCDNYSGSKNCPNVCAFWKDWYCVKEQHK